MCFLFLRQGVTDDERDCKDFHSSVEKINEKFINQMEINYSM